MAHPLAALMDGSRAQPGAARAIVLDRLGKTFQTAGRSVEAVRGVSFDVAAGELFGLFGHNGAGKSTLVRMLATLVRPTAGRAEVNGFDLVHAERQVRASIGLVASDERSFYGRLSGHHNLRFFAALQNVPRSQVAARVEYVLALFGLEQIAARPFQTYSTGQRQRLNMARALLHDPPILFLDEPTKSMDVQTSDFVKALVKSELAGRQHKTVVFISHELYEMEDFCERVAIIHRGELRALGRPADLIRQVPLQPQYALKVRGDPGQLLRALQASALFCAVEATPGAEGEATVRFQLPESESGDGAPAWQAQLWQSVAAAQLRVESFQAAAGRSLRDVIRHYSQES